MKGGNQEPAISASEHIGPDSTGDNVYAKRVAQYVWNGAEWARDTGGGGIQYTDNDPQSVGPTGTQVMYWNSGSEIMRAVSDIDGLPVFLSGGNISEIGSAVTIQGERNSEDPDDNPLVVKVGTKYNSIQPVFADSDRGEFQMDSRGNQKVNAGLHPVDTSLVNYSVRLAANATTTPTSSTAYISSIVISCEVAGNTSTITIQDKQGTPFKLVDLLTTVAATTVPTVVNFQTPIEMTGGIDIITAGTGAATLNVWVNYYQ